ncbi:DNA-binding response regulator, partial [Streptomyces albidoflavus]
NLRISERLHLSQATVKSHLVHIYAKLGVDSRTAAVAAALERGLIRR